MKRSAFTLAGLLLSGMAIAQDLPPGALLLARVKSHVNEEVQRLSTVSCLETVRRELQPAKGKMRPLDTIRLEVLTNGHKELFASPGERKFSDRHPLSFAGSGTLGNGIFGLYLKDIVAGESVSHKYKGEEESAGRFLARYDYRVPVLFSGQTIDLREGSGRVGLHGSFWVDPQTFDVVRLELNGDDFPPALPVTELKGTIRYARTRLSTDRTVLLPETADFRLVKESGEISRNRVDFTHCRVFGAESTIQFESPDSVEPAPRFGASAVEETMRPLNGGLRIAVELRTRITSETAVGALIDGVVAKDVGPKQAVAIPAGSPVRGRIRRLERYTDPFPYFVVGLEFTEVEAQGIRHLFYADLIDLDRAPGVELTLSTKDTTETAGLPGGSLSMRQTKENFTLYHLPGVALFFVKGGTLDLPRDFRTIWKTRLRP